MKKWKSYLLRLPVYLILVALLGVGIWRFYRENGLPEELQNAIPTEVPTVPPGVPPEELIEPEDNLFQLGDTFPIYNVNDYTGHLEGKITSARFVTSPEDCPREWICPGRQMYVYKTGCGAYDYEEWFIPGGALDMGAQLVRLEMELTNVDAVAIIEEEYPTVLEEDVFVPDYLLHMTDLQDMDQYRNTPMFHVIGHSQYPHTELEDDPRAKPNNSFNLKIPQGETVKLSMIVEIYGYSKTRDPAYLFAFAGTGEYDAICREARNYIVLNLEETP